MSGIATMRSSPTALLGEKSKEWRLIVIPLGGRLPPIRLGLLISTSFNTLSAPVSIIEGILIDVVDNWSDNTSNAHRSANFAGSDGALLRVGCGLRDPSENRSRFQKGKIHLLKSDMSLYTVDQFSLHRTQGKGKTIFYGDRLWIPKKSGERESRHTTQHAA